MITARITFLALLLSLPLVAQESVLTLDRGQAYEFTWDGQNNGWVSRVYVTPKPQFSKKAITVTVKSIAAGSRTDPGLTGLFQVSLVQPSTPLVSFDILVPKNASVLPGTYQATLVFAAAQTEQTANVQLTIPSAILTGPPTFQLTRVLFWPFPVDNPKLEIWETSGKSPADVQARQTEPFASAEGQFGGQIQVDPGALVQDGHTTLNYTLHDDFPIGPVSAKIAISSHQSQAPLVIPVQVRTRLTRVVLLIIIITGLALGFFLRIVLKPKIETGEARKRAAEAYKNLADSNEIPDATFQEAVWKALSDLQKAVQAATATSVTIDAAITTAGEARQKALDNLQIRLKDAETKINQLAEVVTPAWILSGAMTELLTVAKERVEIANHFLKASDAVNALATVQSATDDLRTSLSKRTEDWRNSAAHLLRQFAGLKSLMQADRREECATSRKNLEDEAGKAKIDPAGDVAGIKTALEAAHGFTTMLSGFLRAAADDVRAGFAGMDDVIKDIALPKKELWADARNSTEALVTRLSSISPVTPAGWENVSLDSTSLLGQWRNALTSQKPDADGVATAFDAGNFELAATDLEKALDVRSVGTTLDDSASPEALDSVVASQPYSSPGDVSAPEPASTKATAPSLMPFAAFAVISSRELMNAKILQAVISGVALTLVGYLIFADKFVGTSGDLLSAFFWGFTTDIGVDALISAAKTKAG